MSFVNQKKVGFVQPFLLKTADDVRVYNKAVDALSAYSDLVEETHDIPVPRRFEEPKFIPTCVCGNDDLKRLNFLSFVMEVNTAYGYDAAGHLNVEYTDTDRTHAEDDISITKEQEGLFLYCKDCKAVRKITDEEYKNLAW